MKQRSLDAGDLGVAIGVGFILWTIAIVLGIAR